MAIYTPTELVNSAPAATVEEAIVKGVVNTICVSAPLLAGFGLATGNIPAIAFGVSGSIVCQLPLLPLADPPPPAFIPVTGGQCLTNYRVVVQAKWIKPGGFTRVETSPEKLIPGPIGGLYVVNTPIGDGSIGKTIYCQYGTQGRSIDWLNVISSPGDGRTDWEWYNYIFLQREDGLPDNCGNAPISQPSLPPGSTHPPGWPENPYLPGGRDTQPYLPPGDDDGRRPWSLPIIVAPVILPVTVNANGSLSFPINAPINIKAGLEILPDAQITGEINIQLDGDGNYRTPPDLLPEEEPPVICPEVPEISSFNVPYAICDQDGGDITSDRLQVVSSSVPPGLFNRLLDSAELALIGCDQRPKEPVTPVLIASGASGSLDARLWSVLVPDPETVVVRLEITSHRQKDIKETIQFAGTGQRLFAVISSCLEGGVGGGDAVECWDEKTDLRIEKSSLPRRIKVLTRAGISWELWDTGERS